MSEVLDTLSSATRDSVESLVADAQAETVSVPYLEEPAELTQEVAYRDDGNIVVVRLRFGGVPGVYTDLVTTTWSPATLVYELSNSHGLGDAGDYPQYGTKIDNDNDEVWFEVPVEAN
jgi:hypothetical protein